MLRRNKERWCLSSPAVAGRHVVIRWDSMVQGHLSDRQMPPGISWFLRTLRQHAGPDILSVRVYVAVILAELSGVLPSSRRRCPVPEERPASPKRKVKDCRGDVAGMCGDVAGMLRGCCGDVAGMLRGCRADGAAGNYVYHYRCYHDDDDYYA